MRLVSGGVPGMSIGDHFAAMRDNPQLAQPANPSEAVATADVHAPMPPSKAHLKRLARHAAGVPFVEKLPAKGEPSAQSIAARRRLDFHKQVVAALGGSMVIVGDEDARRAALYQPTLYETTLQRWRRETL